MPGNKSPSPRDDIQARLNELRVRYAASLPDKIRQLQAQWQAVCAAPDDPRPREQLELACHKLAGSGSSYGFPWITRLARQAETLLRGSHGRPLTARERQTIETLLQRLAESVQDAGIGT